MHFKIHPGFREVKDAKVHDPELFALTQEVAQFSKIPKIKQVWLVSQVSNLMHMP